MADEDKRLIAAIGMMGSTSAGGDGEAQNAFRTATELLARRKMTWVDVAQRAFGQPEAHTPTPSPTPSPSSGPRGFGDIFDDFVEATFSTVGFGSTQRGGSTRPRARTRVDGPAIPTEITGTVKTTPSGGSRDGEIMTLDIVGEFDTYGPLICFAASVRSDLTAAAARGRRVVVRVRQPGKEGQMPVVTSVGTL